MDTKAETEPTVIDTVKLVLAGGIVFAGIYGYTSYPEIPVVLRALGMLASFGLAVWVALQAAQGQTLWRFIQASRIELRKVVWPTREDTIQTTVAVLIFAAIMGVFFWLLDLFLLWFTRFVTGQGA
jgi:preprotein translocase subunit SecE